MSVLGAAFISFFGIALLTSHMSRTTLRRICGYALLIDILLHGAVIWMFLGTSTLGLLQAELSAIFVTLAIRVYRWCHGYERLSAGGWVRYAGYFNRNG